MCLACGDATKLFLYHGWNVLLVLLLLLLLLSTLRRYLQSVVGKPIRRRTHEQYFRWWGRERSQSLRRKKGFSVGVIALLYVKYTRSEMALACAHKNDSANALLICSFAFAPKNNVFVPFPSIPFFSHIQFHLCNIY